MNEIIVPNINTSADAINNIIENNNPYRNLVDDYP